MDTAVVEGDQAGVVVGHGDGGQPGSAGRRGGQKAGWARVILDGRTKSRRVMPTPFSVPIACTSSSSTGFGGMLWVSPEPRVDCCWNTRPSCRNLGPLRQCRSKVVRTASESMSTSQSALTAGRVNGAIAKSCVTGVGSAASVGSVSNSRAGAGVQSCRGVETSPVLSWVPNGRSPSFPRSPPRFDTTARPLFPRLLHVLCLVEKFRKLSVANGHRCGLGYIGKRVGGEIAHPESERLCQCRNGSLVYLVPSENR